MSRPAVAVRCLSLLACLVVLGAGPIGSATAGPIADSFARWSNQRKTQSHVEKPFSGQSGTVATNQSSVLHNLRSRLTSRSNTATSTHTMKTETFHHDGGSLVR